MMVVRVSATSRGALTVIFKGLERPVSVRMPANLAPQKGRSVAFAIDPAQVLLFTADGSIPI